MKSAGVLANRHKDLEKSAVDMRRFVVTAQRKLLEFEVLMSKDEIRQGKSKVYRKTSELIKSIR